MRYRLRRKAVAVFTAVLTLTFMWEAGSAAQAFAAQAQTEQGEEESAGVPAEGPKGADETAFAGETAIIAESGGTDDADGGSADADAADDVQRDEGEDRTEAADDAEEAAETETAEEADTEEAEEDTADVPVTAQENGDEADGGSDPAVQGEDAPDETADTETAAEAAMAEATADYSFTVLDASAKTAFITGYTGTETALVIPETVSDGTEVYTVTEIGNRAFYGKEQIASVEIPSCVTRIGDSAFHFATGLTGVTFAEGSQLTSIGESAFERTKLSSVSIPDSVTSIGRRAFADTYNSSLTSVTFGANSELTQMGDSVFRDNKELLSIAIPKGLTAIPDGTFMNCQKLASATFAQDAQVTEFGEDAFNGCKVLTSIEVPDGVQSIGEDCFSECAALTTVSLPSSLTQIGNNAFWLCEALQEVSMPACAADAGVRIGENVFYKCTNYQDASALLANTVQLGKNAFNYSGITNVQIGGNVNSEITAIPDSVFSHCESLTTVEIPATVTQIGASAFGSCSSLTELTIPEGVVSIGRSAFSSSGNLKTLRLPSTVTQIESSGGIVAFCKSLATITVAQGNTVYEDGGANAIIRKSDHTLIAGCQNTVIPVSVEKIGEYAFTGQTRMAEIKFASGSSRLKTIGQAAFSNCESLTQVTLPAGLKTIEEQAFNYCSAMTAIHLPDGMTDISTGALSYTGLTSLRIPFGITELKNSFVYSAPLGKVTLPSSIEKIGQYGYSPFPTSLSEAVYYGDQAAWDGVEKDFGSSLAVNGVSLTATGDINIANADITVSPASYAYTGSAIIPAVQASYRGIAMKAGRDYTIACTNNVNGGTATVTISGKGSFYGSTAKNFTITGGSGGGSTPVPVKKITPSVKLAAASYVYNGKVKTPAVTVKDGSKVLVKNTDYTVAYASGRKAVGTYKVTVTLKGGYSGSKTVSFKIVPKGTKLKSLTAGSKKVTVKWTKQAAQTTGYQIQYSTSSTFAKAKKTVTVSKAKTVSKVIQKLTGGKKYYFRIRTYKTVKGTKYYSAWSAKKAVKVKK